MNLPMTVKATTCAIYRKVKGGCSSHQIHNVQVEEILLKELHRISAYARERESEFIALVTKQSEKDLNRQLRDSHKELEQAKCRIAKLDTIVQRFLKIILMVRFQTSVLQECQRPTMPSRNS